MQEYIFTKAQNESDLQQLATLFKQVFHPDEVGELARQLTHHLPGMSYQNWYIAKEKTLQEIVCGFVLIPWQWQMEGIDLKVAEMGIVGTKEQYRGKGLFKETNRLFQQDLVNNNYDLSVIQGIPGIYHRLGYHYALPFEHHTELPLYAIANKATDYKISLASEGDLPLFLNEEKKHNSRFAIGVQRSEEHWKYILSEGRKTDYASDMYIIEASTEAWYIRLLHKGFGQGLIVSEASDDMPLSVLEQTLVFLKQEAIKRNKVYIRLNLPDAHCLVKHALNYEARLKPAYAWQVKVIDPKRFITKIATLLEQRIKAGKFRGLTATVLLDFYTAQLSLRFANGKLLGVDKGPNEAADYVMSIPDDLFAPLVLGHRSWRELQFNRPDIFPADQYLRIETTQPAEVTGDLMDTLFPKLNSWVYCQY